MSRRASGSWTWRPGIGEPALTAVAVVGPTGRVVGVDPAPGLLALARERAAGAGHVEFHQAAAGAGPLPRAPFDAAVCRWGPMLRPDPDAAARAVREALRPGGVIAAAAWGTATQVPLLSLPRGAVAAHVEVPPADPLAPGPIRLGEPGALAAVLETAGFVHVAS
ncbi:MAG: class I SAM-dependent methyltransferase [Planctomycetota bacterium]